ncbi:hypothetical protein DL768_006782 [Monosporascus sp. mg162]|nr:hypothetical protein DL768_006782 [Monosporascus sp. mg162]
MAPFHGADVAECFEAASKIKPNDPESWCTAWTKAAHVAEGSGERALPSGDREAGTGNVRLPAYLYLPNLPPADRENTPVIVQTSGFDSVQGEIYYFMAVGARACTYATLTFDGPGQGIVLVRDKLHMRPDWEVVVSAVVDELLLLVDERPEWNLDT